METASILTYVWLAVFIFSCGAGWWLTVLGLPGNWLIVVSSALLAWLFPVQGDLGFGWRVVFLLAGLAVVGEVLEAISGAAGLAKGGTKRGAFGAVIGSFIGGVMGAGLGLPVPLLGPIVGTLLFASLGAMIGAVYAESTGGRSLEKSLSIGKAAFMGRLLASLAKLAIASVMASVAVLSALL